eukprot:4713200-Prymnesium_polylepis.1
MPLPEHLSDAIKYAYDERYRKEYAIVDKFNQMSKKEQQAFRKKDARDHDGMYTCEDSLISDLDVPRCNHGLAHAIRKALMVRDVASVCCEHFYSKEDRKAFAFSEKQLCAMEVAMIFEVCGRESEVGFNDDRAVYKGYHATSCRVFDEYAKDHMADEQRDEAREALEMLYDPDAGAMTRVFEYIHEMDMLRCSDADIMHPKVDRLAETVDADAYGARRGLVWWKQYAGWAPGKDMGVVESEALSAALGARKGKKCVALTAAELDCCEIARCAIGREGGERARARGRGEGSGGQLRVEGLGKSREGVDGCEMAGCGHAATRACGAPSREAQGAPTLSHCALSPCALSPGALSPGALSPGASALGCVRSWEKLKTKRELCVSVGGKTYYTAGFWDFDAKDPTTLQGGTRQPRAPARAPALCQPRAKPRRQPCAAFSRAIAARTQRPTPSDCSRAPRT